MTVAKMRDNILLDIERLKQEIQENLTVLRYLDKLNDNSISAINGKPTRGQKPFLPKAIIEILTQQNEFMRAVEILKVINMKFSKEYSVDEFSGRLSSVINKNKAKLVKLELDLPMRNRFYYGLREWVDESGYPPTEVLEKLILKSETEKRGNVGIRKGTKLEKPLKINGTFDEVLQVLVDNPK